MLAARDGAAHAGPAGGGRMTLEERLERDPHEARTNGSTECPVCRGADGASPGGGRGARCRAAPMWQLRY